MLQEAWPDTINGVHLASRLCSLWLWLGRVLSLARHAMAGVHRTQGMLGVAIGGAPGNGPVQPRSRSPTPRGPAWSVGLPDIDTQFATIGFDDEDLERLADIPLEKRRPLVTRIVSKFRNAELTNPGGYLKGAIKNHFSESKTSGKPGFSPRGMANRSPGAAGSTSELRSEPAHPVQAAVQSSVARPNTSCHSDLIHEMLALREQPQALVQSFSSALTVSQSQWYQTLPPFEAAAIAWAFVLAAEHDAGHRETWFTNVMQRYAALIGGQGPLPGAVPATCSRIAVQVVLAGMSIASAVSVAACLESQSRIQVGVADIQIAWLPAILLHELHEKTLSIERCCEAFGNLEIRGATSPDALLKDIDKNIISLRSSLVKFVVLTVASPHARCSLKLHSGSSVLHGENSYTFQMLHFVDGVRTLLGDNCICEAIMIQQQDAGKHVADIWGERVEHLPPDTWFDVRPTPAVYGVPSNMVIAQAMPDLGLHDAPLKGQTRPTVSQLPAVLPGECVRPSALDKFTNALCFGAVNATEDELKTVGLLKTGQVEGLPALPGRQWWLQWWCLKPQISAHLYDESYPCLEFINNWNGLKAKADGQQAAAACSNCGRVRYCVNCAKVCKDLDRGFVELSMVNTIMAMVSNCAPEWSGHRRGDQALMWGRPDASMRKHVCHAKCMGTDRASSSGSVSSQI